MATSKKEIVSFEFRSNGDVLGRATWLGPGMVELDFEDSGLRRRFEKMLAGPEPHGGPVFDLSNVYERWPDESRLFFAEACLSLNGIYQVRQVR